MRLTSKQHNVIKKSFLNIFKSGEIYLFGSRVDDEKRGGDIDLYIVTDNQEHLVQKKIKFLVDVKREIGEQKIDIVFNKDENRPIELEAKEHGVLL